MKKLCVFKTSNTARTPWIDYTFEQIEKFVKYEENNYEIVQLKDLKKGDTVYFCGYSTSKIVDFIIDIKKDGITGIIIENICCDDSVKLHKTAIEKLFINGFEKIRSMNFLKNEIKKVFLDFVSENHKSDEKILGNTFLSDLNFDSIDIMNLACEVEDKFNTELNQISYTKPIKVKDFVSLLESGQISSKFER